MGFSQGTEEKERKRQESVISKERYIRVPLYSFNCDNTELKRLSKINSLFPNSITGRLWVDYTARVKRVKLIVAWKIVLPYVRALGRCCLLTGLSL